MCVDLAILGSLQKGGRLHRREEFASGCLKEQQEDKEQGRHETLKSEVQ